jgi:hypothetical protein
VYNKRICKVFVSFSVDSYPYFGRFSMINWSGPQIKIHLRTTALEKLVYILVSMNETSILHLAGGKVTLQARRAVNQSKKPADGKIMFV